MSDESPAKGTCDGDLTKSNCQTMTSNSPGWNSDWRRKLLPRRCWCIAALSSILAFSALAEQDIKERLLASPNGRIQVSIQMPARGSAAKPRWSATFHG